MKPGAARISAVLPLPPLHRRSLLRQFGSGGRIFSVSGRTFSETLRTMPSANANSNGSVDRVSAAALEHSGAGSPVIGSHAANVQTETFNVAAGLYFPHQMRATMMSC